MMLEATKGRLGRHVVCTGPCWYSAAVDTSCGDVDPVVGCIFAHMQSVQFPAVTTHCQGLAHHTRLSRMRLSHTLWQPRGCCAHWQFQPLKFLQLTTP